jgi:hypothetical protein
MVLTRFHHDGRELHDVFCLAKVAAPGSGDVSYLLLPMVGSQCKYVNLHDSAGGRVARRSVASLLGEGTEFQIRFVCASPSGLHVALYFWRPFPLRGSDSGRIYVYEFEKLFRGSGSGKRMCLNGVDVRWWEDVDLSYECDNRLLLAHSKGVSIVDTREAVVKCGVPMCEIPCYALWSSGWPDQRNPWPIVCGDGSGVVLVAVVQHLFAYDAEMRFLWQLEFSDAILAVCRAFAGHVYIMMAGQVVVLDVAKRRGVDGSCMRTVDPGLSFCATSGPGRTFIICTARKRAPGGVRVGNAVRVVEPCLRMAMVAMCMGRHARLGEGSIVRKLGDDVTRMIWRYVRSV